MAMSKTALLSIVFLSSAGLAATLFAGDIADTVKKDAAAFQKFDELSSACDAKTQKKQPCSPEEQSAYDTKILQLKSRALMMPGGVI